ncbi:MAG: hypothetical protein HGB34_02450 [Candidatus Moranbacteria bacterium]|nr:hypothetical protein [Candidatus Moranbacteria bacterium]
MKVLLNLLPEENKVIIRRNRFDRFLFRQSVMLISVVVFYLGVLWSVFLIVHENRKFIESAGRTSEIVRSEVVELSAFETKFREANMIAGQANRFLESSPNWAGFLVRMDRLVPPDVSLNAMTTRGFRISLSGMAKTREDFLAFESALKRDECLVGFVIPVSNLFSETNVEFQMDFSVSEECLIGEKAS